MFPVPVGAFPLGVRVAVSIGLFIDDMRISWLRRSPCDIFRGGAFFSARLILRASFSS